MNIAIDFDGTFCRNPDLWRTFWLMCKDAGWSPWIVSSRVDDPENYETIMSVTGLPKWRIILTSMSAKRWFCEQRGLKIDVWIDDDPACIENGK